MSQISFFDGQNRLTIDKPVRLIECFAGIGAQSKALENLGVPFEHYRICEFDKFAVKSYNAIHGTNFEPSDITKIHADDLAVVDTDSYFYILTYSFPCQDLSKAGKQRGMSKGTSTRSGLLWEVERLLREMKELPQILLMENVPDVVSGKNIKDFAEWIAFLDSLGYRSKYEILNAKNYGIPQNRERCFMVSWLGDYYYDFPEPIPLEKRLKDVCEPIVDESYYLKDNVVQSLISHKERNQQKGNGFGWNPVTENDIAHALVTSAQKSNCNYFISRADGIYTQATPLFQRGPLKDVSRTLKAEQHDAGVAIYENPNIIEFANLYPKIKGYNRMNGVICDIDGVSQTIRENSGWHNEVKIAAIRGRNPENPSDRTVVIETQQRLEIGGDCSNTLTTVQKDNVVIEPSIRVRKLTPRECFRLMDFTDADFDKASAVNSNSQLYKQAGNSIVVNCLTAILGQMFEGKEDYYKQISLDNPTKQ